MKTVFIYPPAWAPWAPSYAMALLSAGAKQRGHAFIGFDLNIDFHNAVNEQDRKLWLDENVVYWSSDTYLMSLLTRYSTFIDAYIGDIIVVGADLYGFSVNEASSLFARIIAKKIKEKEPSAVILFGGPDCFRSEKGLNLLEDHSVDAVCTGEADHAWPEFLDAFEQNGFTIQGITTRGICYKTEKGNIVDNGDPDIVGYLDEIPFADYDSIDFSKYTLNNRVCLMMSRGCINRCAYCSEGPNFLKYRYRSAENLFQEVRKQVDLLRRTSNTRPHINFSDSLINGRPEILSTFCDRVIKEGIDFTWGGMALLRKEMNYDFLFKMRRAGCVEICWGLESGSAKVLELMRKRNFTPQMAEGIFKMAKELGFQQYTNIIVGFPGETEELFLETAQFVLRNRKYFGRMGVPLLAIRKNSYLSNNYHKYGIESPDTDNWRTIDNSNTHELRVARRNLLIGILEDKLFDQGRYDEKKLKEASGVTEVSKENNGRDKVDGRKIAVSNLIKLGEKFFSKGNHKDALELFMRVAEIAPDNYENWNDLAVILMHVGMMDNAESCLKKAIALKVDYQEAHENLKRLKETMQSVT